MYCLHRLGRVRSAFWSLLLCSSIAGAFLGCGGANKTPAVRSAPDPFPDPKTTISRPHISSIRVLLLEDFDTCLVDGVEEGDGLLIEVTQGELLLARGEGNEQVVLKRGSGFRLKAAPAGFVRLNGKAYRGDVEAFVNPLGTAVIVNELPIEDYLRAVVPLELGPKLFPYTEALSTQAVAARTFAVVHLGTWASRGFDLFADTRSQVYGGVAVENRVSDQAIARTRGRVSTYRGEPIISLYSSTCGGVTEAFELIFRGKPIEYLQGGVNCWDRDSQYYSWKETIDLNDIQESLKRYAGVGRLVELLPTAYGRSERTVRMEFVGNERTKVLKGNDIRFALGLRSNLITALKTVKGPDGYIRQIQVQGRGWGHGVGLCQMGAVNLARRGRTYHQILRHYYPGTAVVEWY